MREIIVALAILAITMIFVQKEHTPKLPCNYFSVIERTKCITDERVEQ